MRCCFSAHLPALAALSAFPGPCEVLRSGARLAPALLRSASAAMQRARSHHPDALAAVNLELVTLTEDSAVITWYTGIPEPERRGAQGVAAREMQGGGCVGPAS
ncbi:hypothetical protein ACQF36_41330 [Streptomyces sp. Marseille-Q5077]|uniref:hypothetical protein n=1 Tax=Streptomyces sp. Marseille-Q5077 TaxID=3418995 RepID=UPI003D054C85